MTSNEETLKDYTDTKIDSSLTKDTSLLNDYNEVQDNLEFQDTVEAVRSDTIQYNGAQLKKKFYLDTTQGIWFGIDSDGIAKINIGDGTNSFKWDGTAVTIIGSLTATAGTIGGFSIGSDYIRDVANSFGLASTVTGGDDVRFWAGDTFANRATAPFRVTEAGAVTANNIAITGGSVVNSVLNTSIQRATSDITFTSTDNDTISWSSGTIITSAGVSYLISAGNTGNMSALTYIYLDIAVSTTVLQTTTTYSTAVGNGKILVATAQNASSGGALCLPFLGGKPLINGQAQINASSILAGQLSVSELSAITADLGSITAGDITVDSSGFIRGGQTAYNTGTGFFLGYSTAAYKFSIGDASTNYLTWDGSTLSIRGILNNYTEANASNTLQQSADTERSSASDTYVSVKDILVRIGGTVRVKFDLKTDVGTSGFAKIYVNDVAVGTERQATGTSYTNFSEDISVDPFDNVQLYIKNTSGGADLAIIRNFRIYYDLASANPTSVVTD